MTWNQIKYSSPIFSSSKEAKQPACLTTSPAVTFSRSKVFIFQLPADTLPACYSWSCTEKGTNSRSSAEVDALESRRTGEKGDVERAGVDGDEIELD